jgi:hypothetical protein
MVHTITGVEKRKVLRIQGDDRIATPRMFLKKILQDKIK